MTRFFTADLHLGHRNIIDYSGRPFRDVDEMNVALIERWNETVDDADEVIVLGDFAMGRIDETLPLVGVLHGRKVLLTGNHDRCWFGHRKGVETSTARYLDAGFDEIWQDRVELDLAGRRVTACHFPYRGDSHDHDRYVAHRPVDKGAWLLHGHVHERWQVRDRMINVGVDVWAYRPVSERDLSDLVTARAGHPCAPVER
ncbi:MAG: metallophosphoesterase [Acidimicrobiales bacterium]|jgi:calcineurin-like phosphoesterase family protein|nr:metallophosphoesterase [Acidimicrobiales bacterium]